VLCPSTFYTLLVSHEQGFLLTERSWTAFRHHFNTEFLAWVLE
jgi:hypothetical protein